jgi:hypothetical protein
VDKKKVGFIQVGIGIQHAFSVCKGHLRIWRKQTGGGCAEIRTGNNLFEYISVKIGLTILSGKKTNELTVKLLCPITHMEMMT